MKKVILSIALALGLAGSANAIHVDGTSHGTLGSGEFFGLGVVVGFIANVAYQNNEWHKANPEQSKALNTYVTCTVKGGGYQVEVQLPHKDKYCL